MLNRFLFFFLFQKSKLIRVMQVTKLILHCNSHLQTASENF